MDAGWMLDGCWMDERSEREVLEGVGRCLMDAGWMREVRERCWMSGECAREVRDVREECGRCTGWTESV